MSCAFLAFNHQRCNHYYCCYWTRIYIELRKSHIEFGKYKYNCIVLKKYFGIRIEIQLHGSGSVERGAVARFLPSRGSPAASSWPSQPYTLTSTHKPAIHSDFHTLGQPYTHALSAQWTLIHAQEPKHLGPIIQTHSRPLAMSVIHSEPHTDGH